ncbi:hypothetical protein [Streptomyces sp. A 4/2]|uniref:hypothetical protein n=1 Tax=Streptomyces sp. A 4/2 TaxID=2934314 RepID=UPI00202579D2|nr:hypothetical protein [Streptomyces sp. A 4/2]
MKLADLRDLMRRRRADYGLGLSFDDFRVDPMVASLRWPADVVEQFLYDHGDHGPFQRDYRNVDLTSIVWTLETVTAAELSTMPTGPSEAGCIEQFALHPGHYISVRSSGIHVGVPEKWRDHGTWKRPPLLLDRRLLDPSTSGLHVLEGRTRVGILRGRLRENDFVAATHEVWVGRPARSR